MPTDKQRRATERRRLQRQLERRRQQAERRKRLNLVVSIVATLAVIALVVVLVSLNSGDDTTTASSPTPSAPTTSTQASYPCTWTASQLAAARKVTVPPTTKPPRTGTVRVSIPTTRGTIDATLDRAKAPCTVASFVSLAKQGYYDKTPCHRLAPGLYILQCGDPTGTSTGTPGYTVPDEATGAETYPAGTIALARGQTPHSGGGQFFIVYKNSPSLRQGLGTLQYTVFGTITSGLKIVQQVAAKGVSGGGSDGKPAESISLKSVTTKG